MKRLVIFDLDGTLLNTIDDLAAAVNHALALHGYPLHAVEKYPDFVGNGIDKLLERALPCEVRTEEEVLKIKRDFVSYYDKYGTSMTRPYEGIKNLLATLQQQGIMLAVASNKYQTAALHIVNHYFGEIKFEAVLGQRDGVPKKPHPAIVNEILSIAQVGADDALYVGDSDVDMITAYSAGVESVGVSWGFRSEENLREAHASHVIHHPDELLTYL